MQAIVDILPIVCCMLLGITGGNAREFVPNIISAFKKSIERNMLARTPI